MWTIKEFVEKYHNIKRAKSQVKSGFSPSFFALWAKKSILCGVRV